MYAEMNKDMGVNIINCQMVRDRGGSWYFKLFFFCDAKDVYLMFVNM